MIMDFGGFFIPEFLEICLKFVDLFILNSKCPSIHIFGVLLIHI